jgi:hypothetical protein
MVILVSLKLLLERKIKRKPLSLVDEGITNRPSTFAYQGFGPAEITVEGNTRPIKAAARCGPGFILGVQARGRRVQVELDFD